ncbi:NAD-dependent epimerase/dehydratase family protein [Hymenobacter rubidus]|uniref:NAD-dependent epimerase/dehydratase family protein n=1 Tax=Hymenobacter rubidus TaxID=1441626 RepID=UPI00191E580F|nr:NAD-dependent epimerase/dehydratase family protein [Hymenobacter rubidus]
MRKILLIGATGFVGQHIREVLAADMGLELRVTARQPTTVDTQTIPFDFHYPASWQHILDVAPDIIVNAAGYGVVKEQTDLEAMYDVNYRLPVRLIKFLHAAGQEPFWLQVGTAFEYDLTEERLHEDSACVPLTHYGMSKYLCSNFLQSTANSLPFLILRPFAMFGPYESDSKLLPYLLNAQKMARPIQLSSGKQERDYFYVRDLACFINYLINNGLHELDGAVLNVGSGHPTSLKDLATSLSKFIPDFRSEIWKWGEVAQRANETQVFYNASTKATQLKLQLTPSSQAFQETISYYYQQR